MLASARSSSWPAEVDGRASSAASNARRRRGSAARAPAGGPPPGSTGPPRVRATTRSPNAASSSPKDCSTAAMAMRPEDTRRGPRRCHHAPMQIQFLGGATTVTGSQYLLATDRAKILIDCGMFQGSPNESIRNRLPFAFDPAELDAVLLTHAHLDHCGLLPLLVKDGYRGPIHATAGTIELATLVLLDSGKLHEEFAKREARWEKRHPDEVEADDRREADEYQAAVDLAAAAGDGRRSPRRRSAPTSPPRRPATRTSTSPTSSRPEPEPAAPGRATPRPSCAPSRRTSRSTSTQPLYTAKDAELSLAQFKALALRRRGRGRARASTPRSWTPGTSWARRSSGSGSRSHEGGEERIIVFSGDLGRPGTPILRDPTADDRRRLRPRRVDLRRSRARARGRGDPRPRRDGPDGGRRRRRPARPVLRDRADAGGRLGARPAHRARRDPAPAAVPRFADGLEGVRHLPPPPRLLRRGDGQAPARGRDATRLPEPDRHQRREGLTGDRVRAAAVHDRRLERDADRRPRRRPPPEPHRRPERDDPVRRLPGRWHARRPPPGRCDRGQARRPDPDRPLPDALDQRLLGTRRREASCSTGSASSPRASDRATRAILAACSSSTATPKPRSPSSRRSASSVSRPMSRTGTSTSRSTRSRWP